MVMIGIEASSLLTKERGNPTEIRDVEVWKRADLSPQRRENRLIGCDAQLWRLRASRPPGEISGQLIIRGLLPSWTSTYPGLAESADVVG